jgi:hypothetical protein
LSGTFTLKLEKTDRCQLGDADVIRADLAATNTATALLTIEDQQGSVFFRADVSTRIFFGAHKIRLPASTAGTLGVYLCKDARKTGRCSDKPAAAMGDLANLTMFSSPEDDRSPYQTDKIYYYQPLQPVVASDPGAKKSFELLRTTGALPLAVEGKSAKLPLTALNKKACRRHARLVVEQMLRVSDPEIGWPGPIKSVERN